MICAYFQGTGRLHHKGKNTQYTQYPVQFHFIEQEKACVWSLDPQSDWVPRQVTFLPHVMAWEMQPAAAWILGNLAQNGQEAICSSEERSRLLNHPLVLLKPVLAFQKDIGKLSVKKHHPHFMQEVCGQESLNDDVKWR